MLVTADHCSYAAGRDLTIHQCALRACPGCELRIIAAKARSCRSCRRRRKIRAILIRITRRTRRIRRH